MSGGVRKALWIAACLAGLALIYVAWELISACSYGELTRDELDKAAGNGVTRLMIVAHPDDETIWGGGHLSDGGYLVLCVTDGKNATRSAEFENAVTASGNSFVILDYPDKTLFRRNKWRHCMKDIKADVDTALAYRDWELVVTHNPDGEYGHEHHKMLSAAVTEEYDRLGCTAPLYYFGHYYTEDELEALSEKPEALSDERLAKKREALTAYTSQSDVVENLSHMQPYECWTLYGGK